MGAAFVEVLVVVLLVVVEEEEEEAMVRRPARLCSNLGNKTKQTCKTLSEQ